MASKLVIVESPAKAKTIGSYLGRDYDVQASIGHIRDLPQNGRDLPEALRKKAYRPREVCPDGQLPSDPVMCCP